MITDLPASNRFQMARHLSICHIFTGMWRLSDARERIPLQTAIADRFDDGNAGCTTGDLGNPFRLAEDLIGNFRRQPIDTRSESALSRLQVFTQWISQPIFRTKTLVEHNIKNSPQPRGVDCREGLPLHQSSLSCELSIEFFVTVAKPIGNGIKSSDRKPAEQNDLVQSGRHYEI
jgi:hypothetical protein